MAFGRIIGNNKVGITQRGGASADRQRYKSLPLGRPAVQGLQHTQVTLVKVLSINDTRYHLHCRFALSYYPILLLIDNATRFDM